MLRSQFADEPIFLEVVDSLLALDKGEDPEVIRRAKHRAEEYMIEGGKLWKVQAGTSVRAQARVECGSRKEAIELAWTEHEENGHWHRLKQ